MAAAGGGLCAPGLGYAVSLCAADSTLRDTIHTAPSQRLTP